MEKIEILGKKIIANPNITQKRILDSYNRLQAPLISLQEYTLLLECVGNYLVVGNEVYGTSISVEAEDFFNINYVKEKPADLICRFSIEKEGFYYIRIKYPLCKEYIARKVYLAMYEGTLTIISQSDFNFGSELMRNAKFMSMHNAFVADIRTATPKKGYDGPGLYFNRRNED